MDVEIAGLDLVRQLEQTSKLLLISGNSEWVSVGSLGLDGSDFEGNEDKLGIKCVGSEEFEAQTELGD